MWLNVLTIVTNSQSFSFDRNVFDALLRVLNHKRCSTKLCLHLYFVSLRFNTLPALTCRSVWYTTTLIPNQWNITISLWKYYRESTFYTMFDIYIHVRLSKAETLRRTFLLFIHPTAKPPDVIIITFYVPNYFFSVPNCSLPALPFANFKFDTYILIWHNSSRKWFYQNPFLHVFTHDCVFATHFHLPT